MNLLEAGRLGNIEKVKEFLKQDADPVDCNWALIYASFSGQTDIVEVLLQDGRANPAYNQNEPLKWACRQGHTNVVALLLQDVRVNPAANDNEPLKCASYYGHINLVEFLLLDGRVDPSANDDWIIMYAKTSEIREMLVSYKYRADGAEYCRLKEASK